MELRLVKRECGTQCSLVYFCTFNKSWPSHEALCCVCVWVILVMFASGELRSLKFLSAAHKTARSLIYGAI